VLRRTHILAAFFAALMLVLSAASWAAPTAWDKPTTPMRSQRALRSVIRAVMKSAAHNEHPVVVVDIDDTVADGRVRLRVAAKAAGLPSTNLHSASDLYEGLSGDALAERLDKFGALYFNDPKLAKLDTAQKGASAFLRAIEQAGGRVLYVSGRWESTRAATMAFLHSLDRPLTHASDLLLNPSALQPASAWKLAVRADVARAGKPIAFFDNEAEAIAGYKESFPGSRAFRLATFRFRAAPDEMPKGVVIVKDFSLDR